MKRYWLGGLVLSLGGLTTAAPAGEVVATSGERVPVATSARNMDSPFATLGPPRVTRGAAPVLEPPRLLPTAYREPAPPATAGPVEKPLETPAVARTPSPPGPVVPAVLKPTGETALPVRPAVYHKEEGFAVERAGFLAPEQVPPPKSAPTPIPPPMEFFESAAMGLDGCTEPMDLGPDREPLPYRFYGSAEYLLWWTKDGPIPPLATTSRVFPGLSDAADPFGSNTGIIGDPNTVVLFGDPLDFDVQHGFRLRAGYWFDTCLPFAVEGSFFALPSRRARFSANSDDLPVLSRPFLDSNGMESRELVGVTTLDAGMLTRRQSGVVTVDAPSEFLGADVNARVPLVCFPMGCRDQVIDLLAGFRYLQLREGLYISEQGQIFGVDATAPNFFRVDDRFDTQNRFYGPQLGLATEFRRGRWALDARGTVALGVSHQVVNINGNAIALNAAGVQIPEPNGLTGGLLALGTNIGRTTQNRFAVVPELTLNVGYYVRDNLKVFAGYNFIYWSSVLRPGDQIDRTLNSSLIPFFGGPSTGILRPQVPLKESDFWASGFNFGLEWTY